MKTNKAEYLNDLLIVKRFFDDPFIKQADGGFLTNASNELHNLLKSSFDKDRPLESLLDFLAPGLIYSKLGSWKLSALYMIASKVFGVDFKTIFEYIKNGIKYAINVGYQFTEETVKTFVDRALETSVPKNPDISKVPETLNEIKNIKKTSSIDETYLLIDNFRDNFDRFYKLSEDQKLNLIKNGGIKEYFSARAILTLLKSLLTFILTSCFSSFKIFLIAAGISGVLLTIFNIKATSVAQPTAGVQTQEVSDKSESLLSKVLHTSRPTAESLQTALPQNLPEALKSYTSFGSEMHSNSSNSVWIERFPSSEIKDVLIDWIIKVYPKLKGKEEIIKSDRSYNTVVGLFNKNNPPEVEQYITIVPKGFNSIKEIVDACIVSAVNKL